MEVFNSVVDTIKERTKNPFFGTLIFVWLCRNWEIVFAIFNFEEGFGLAQKITFINAYYEGKYLLAMFVNNILIALLLMVIGYVLIVATRVLVNLVENNLMPFLNSKTVSKLTVNRITYDSVKKARDDYFNQIFNLQEQLVGSEQKLALVKGEKDGLLKELHDLHTQLSELNSYSKEMALNFDNEKEKLKVVQEENHKYRIELEEILKEEKKKVMRFEHVIEILLNKFPIYSEHNRVQLGETLQLLSEGLKKAYLELISNDHLAEFMDYYDSLSKGGNQYPDINTQHLVEFFFYNGVRNEPTAIADTIYLLVSKGILPSKIEGKK